jgi:putative peptidoglycan lipid II flippase
MSQMLKSSGAMGIATMLSRILGLVREQVYAGFMGTSPIAGAFQFAFAVPNLFRRLLGEGALTAAFIPIFKNKEKTEGEVEMWRAANAVISGLIVSSATVIGLLMLVISLVLLSPRLDAETVLLLRLMRMMAPYILLVCLAAIFMGMLNARGHFFIPALGATMLNVVMISSVLFLAPKMGERLDEQIFALAIGVLAAGVAQALFQMPTLRKEGFRYRWVSPWKNETVREVVRKMLPASVGVAAFQINVMLTQGMAFGSNATTVAIFQYAVRLLELPQGVFGISLATFLLPTLSGFAAEKNYTEFRSTLRQGLGYLLFINVLASVLLVMLAEPIIRLLFQYKEFGELATRSVSQTLMCLAPGLVAFSIVNILARAFYALGDVKTPMRISMVCLAMNVVLAGMFLLIMNLGGPGLGVANTITSVLNMSLLFFALNKKLKTLELQLLVRQLPPILIAGAVAGAIAWGMSTFWQQKIGHTTVLQRLGEVFVPMTAATVIYFAITFAFKVSSASDVINLFMRNARIRK